MCYLRGRTNQNPFNNTNAFTVVITASFVAYHHSCSEIGKVLDCLLKSPVAKIYVVDNSSNDALRLLEKISERIRYIHSANIGYGGAHNIAMREAVEAGADYHVIVNPDIWFGEGVIEILAAYMDHQRGRRHQAAPGNRQPDDHHLDRHAASRQR